MTHAVWDPSAGSPMSPEQRPPVPGTVRSDGSVRGQRSVASEGPCLTEVGGGAGGEPDGASLPIYRVSWDWRKVLEDGKVRPLDVKAGDRILFTKYAGTELKLDGEEHLIIREEDILGVVEGR